MCSPIWNWFPLFIWTWIMWYWFWGSPTGYVLAVTCERVVVERWRSTEAHVIEILASCWSQAQAECCAGMRYCPAFRMRKAAFWPQNQNCTSRWWWIALTKNPSLSIPVRSVAESSKRSLPLFKWVVVFGCTGPYTLGPCLRKCLRMHAGNGKGADAGVLLD